MDTQAPVASLVVFTFPVQGTTRTTIPAAVV